MPDTIRDGKGRGFLAEVTSDNQLYTKCIMEPLATHTSREKGLYYYASSGVVTANSTNQHVVLYIINSDPSNNLKIDRVALSYNGGSTNHNRCCRYRFYRNPGAPTLYNTAFIPGNANFSSQNLFSGTAYIWDASAHDGMTMASTGTVISDNLINGGMTTVISDGQVVIPYSYSLSVSLTPEEIGSMSATVRFYMESASEV